LGGLPAGTYLFSATVHSGAFCTETACFFSDIYCRARLPGEDISGSGQNDPGDFIPINGTGTNVIVHAVPDNASLTVECVTSETDKALAVGRVYALKVDVVN